MPKTSRERKEGMQMEKMILYCIVLYCIVLYTKEGREKLGLLCLFVVIFINEPILTWSDFVRKMFSGLMSLWIMLTAWTYL